MQAHFTSDLSFVHGFNTPSTLANKALHSLLYTQCKTAARKVTKRRRPDGAAALAALMKTCAQITSMDRTRIQKEFLQLRRFDRETASGFIKRFQTKLDDVRHVGFTYTDESLLVDNLLVGLGTHKDYDAIIRSFKSDRRKEERNPDLPERLTVDEVETCFIAEDEALAHQYSRFPRSKEYAMFTQSHQHQQHRRPGSDRVTKTCGYCKKEGHVTYQCRKRKQDQKRGQHSKDSAKSSSQDKGPFKGTCFKCGKPGHMANQCRNTRKERANAVHEKDKKEEINMVSEGFSHDVMDYPDADHSRSGSDSSSSTMPPLLDRDDSSSSDSSTMPPLLDPGACDSSSSSSSSDDFAPVSGSPSINSASSLDLDDPPSVVTLDASRLAQIEPLETPSLFAPVQAPDDDTSINPYCTKCKRWGHLAHECAADDIPDFGDCPYCGAYHEIYECLEAAIALSTGNAQSPDESQPSAPRITNDTPVDAIDTDDVTEQFWDASDIDDVNERTPDADARTQAVLDLDDASSADSTANDSLFQLALAKSWQMAMTSSDTSPEDDPDGDFALTFHDCAVLFSVSAPPHAFMARDSNDRGVQTNPRRNVGPNCHDFRLWLPDSGASAHFTNTLDDLYDTEDCHIEVQVADGTWVVATKKGKVQIIFNADGPPKKQSRLVLHRVLFVPGLNRRLFSIPAFCSNDAFTVHMSQRFIQLDFGDGATFTTPLSSTTDSAHEMATSAADGTPVASEAAPELAPADDEPVPSETRQLPRLALELAHDRLGHRALRSLMAASLHGAWDDYRLTSSHDDWCEGCRIATSRSAARSRRGTPMAEHPFQRIFMDIIPAPSNEGLTNSTAFPCFLLIVDHFSRWTWFEGMLRRNTTAVIRAIRAFMTETRSLGRVQQVEYIRGDADSVFRSSEFQAFGVDNDIAISIAAPDHQEMNSICERAWATIDNMGRSMCVHARLGNHFFYHSRKYASHIINLLVPKDLLDEHGTPTTPHFLAFQRKPRIGHLRVFGCPVSFKRHRPSHEGQVITKKQQLQRASTRGIFVGLPPKQAGYLIYLEDSIGTAHLIVSGDATFDERFLSAIAPNVTVFQGAQDIRSTASSRPLSDIPDPSTREHTGSVEDILRPAHSARGEVDISESGPNDGDNAENVTLWNFDEILAHRLTSGNDHELQVKWNTGEITWEPLANLKEDDPVTVARCAHENGLTDTDGWKWTSEYDHADILPQDNEETDDNADDGDFQDAEEEFQEPMQAPTHSCGLRPRHSNHSICHLHADLADVFDLEDDQVAHAFNTAAVDSQDHPVSMFLPEPQSVKAILQSPPEIRKLWIDALKKEIMNLLNHDTFAIENPMKGEQVIPTKLTNKAKQKSDGTLEKLKCRIVARGDLQKQTNEWEDTWSACASIKTVRMFLAFMTSQKRIIKQGDFVGAFLQAKVRGRFFVRLSPEYRDLFPDLAKWFGVPLRLKRGIYGMTYSGKFWAEEITDWLLSEDFEQSTADPCYFVKYWPDGRWLRLVYYIDDVAYAGSDDATEKEFEKAISGRYKIDFHGELHWFLQMRIHRYADFSYSLDQQRYTMNILGKYCPRDAPFGMPPHRKTPAPIDYVFTKANRPDDAEKRQLAKDYRGLNYRSAICSLLYLALGTRGDIIFIVNKLAKACIDPGRTDYEALLHLFGYLRACSDFGNKYYSDVKESPMFEVLQKTNVDRHSDIVVFTDASWQDCPDTGRSTTGYLIFYRGGVVEANSQLPAPIAMSSAEAEYMSACSGCMAAAHLHMLLYDFKYLGTKNYNKSQLALPSPPTVIMVDNEAAAKISLSDRLTKHARHISR